MLFKQKILNEIKSGNVTLAFRKWEKASVKKGTLLKTSVGLIEIVNITLTAEEKITKKDAISAGFLTKEQLIESFRNNENTELYKIKVKYHSEDPRIALREQKYITHEEFLYINRKLERLDVLSKQGSWTTTVLQAIQQHPRMRAIDLSVITGFEKEWLKINIRKLKNIGLTVSHEVGYEIAPLGIAYMKKLSP
jgi:hypothetical protein